MLDVEQWAQIGRMHFVDRVPIKELCRRTGLARNTVRRALRCNTPPRYERHGRSSKLDPFKGEIERLLSEDPAIPGKRIRELIAELGLGDQAPDQRGVDLVLGPRAPPDQLGAAGKAPAHHPGGLIGAPQALQRARGQ